MHCFSSQTDDLKPKMLERKRNSVVVDWENIFDSKNTTKYRLQILNDFKEWQTIYCGRKTQFKAENLAPCTCYCFRIKVELDDAKDWTYFKAATEDEGPYCSVMHMSRAVKLGKMPLVRKIAHTRPHLLETENKENRTPLVQAIYAGDIQMLQLLIALGSNVNRALFYNKRTPLMVAVYEEQLQIASILIDKGSDENARDINGLNILHYAVDSNRKESVQFCLRILKDLNCQDNNGWTALMRAVVFHFVTAITSIPQKHTIKNRLAKESEFQSSKPNPDISAESDHIKSSSTEPGTQQTTSSSTTKPMKEFR